MRSGCGGGMFLPVDDADRRAGSWLHGRELHWSGSANRTCWPSTRRSRMMPHVSQAQQRLVFIGFADDRRFVGLVFVLFVFVLIIIVVGISRWCRVANAAENMVDATCPLLLQTSVKLYGIGGHVVLLLTCVFEGLACSGSSPSASAQYISANFRYWRLCRSDFATTVRRANSFALARYFSICDCTAHTPAALCKG